MISNRDRRTNGLRWGFEPICAVLQIAPATVRSHLARGTCDRKITDQIISARIKAIHAENYGVYGVRKIRAALAREGCMVAKNRVARLMRQCGLHGATRGRRVFTTKPDPANVRAPDLVGRDFTAAGPNRLWVMDFTYVPTWSGMTYVSFVIDVYSRMIVGWHLDTNMRTDLVMTALEQAIWRRDTLLDGLVAHSDAGSQYTSIRYTDRLQEIGARPSIGTIGDSYDNSLAESLIGLYKTELVWRNGPWRTAEALELETLLYVEWFNQHRLHGELNNATPAEHEAAYYRSNQPQPSTT